MVHKRWLERLYAVMNGQRGKSDEIRKALWAEFYRVEDRFQREVDETYFKNLHNGKPQNHGGQHG